MRFVCWDARQGWPRCTGDGRHLAGIGSAFAIQTRVRQPGTGRLRRGSFAPRRHSASQAVKGGEGHELAELLVQIGRGRADEDAVDALGGVGLRTAALHVDRRPAGVLENLRVAALGKIGRVHLFDLSEPFGRGQPAAGEEPVASPAGAADPRRRIGSICIGLG